MLRRDWRSGSVAGVDDIGVPASHASAPVGAGHGQHSLAFRHAIDHRRVGLQLHALGQTVDGTRHLFALREIRFLLDNRSSPAPPQASCREPSARVAQSSAGFGLAGFHIGDQRGAVKALFNLVAVGKACLRRAVCRCCLPEIGAFQRIDDLPRSDAARVMRQRYPRPVRHQISSGSGIFGGRISPPRHSGWWRGPTHAAPLRRRRPRCGS